MKWKNKGHELDDYAKHLLQMFHGKQRKIYIFGAGLIGTDIAPVFERYQCFAGYLDNDEQKQAAGKNGSKVISLEQYIQEKTEGFIVIAADQKNIPKIEEQLAFEGLKEREDFWKYQEFMNEVFPILSVYEFDVSYVDLAQICLTERCTLKCQDCAHGCFAVDSHSEDLSLETAKESADIFFSKVDIVKEFVLIGGEPFLYRALSEIISYIGEKYRNKIICFSITTNGTILPEQKILDLCQQYDILIRISNYSNTLKHLKKKYEQLEKRLRDYQVSYIMGDSEIQWMDYGFQTVDRGQKEDKLTQVFDKCKTPCREIRGNKYYYCVMARSVSDNLKMNIGKEDYLEFNDLAEDYKRVLLEFEKGYSEKGYLDMCAHCNGADAVNYVIPAAVQLNVQS
ncbi:MAG: radical SAM protein [Clostridiales bacterium]|nr:radical SAM protein [Clostridiales bacterium]